MGPRRAAMWVLASGVALIAAIVSYGHISALGRSHGGTGLAPWLLPLSVDMLIIVGELMLLHEADGPGRRFILGWVLVWSGILATLFANVTYGAQFGWLGAVIWGWPAYSFILAAGGMVAIVRRSTERGESLSATKAFTPASGFQVSAAHLNDAPPDEPDAPAPPDVTELSQADAIRHAIEETGSQDPAEVALWLEQQGRAVARSRISDVLRRDGKHARKPASASLNGGTPHADS